MKKNLLVILIMLLFLCNIVYASDIEKPSLEQSEPAAVYSKNKPVGGWSLMFFTKYEESQVAEVIGLVQNKRVHEIKINYPAQQKNLAVKIQKQIMAKTILKPKLTETDIQDTPTTKYTHDKVVLVLYYGVNQS